MHCMCVDGWRQAARHALERCVGRGRFDEFEVQVCFQLQAFRDCTLEISRFGHGCTTVEWALNPQFGTSSICRRPCQRQAVTLFHNRYFVTASQATNYYGRRIRKSPFLPTIGSSHGPCTLHTARRHDGTGHDVCSTLTTIQPSVLLPLALL